MGDSVNHPDYYNQGSIEVIDFIEDWNLDFVTGNVIKYVARAPYKKKKVEDLKKAKFYLERLIRKAIAEEEVSDEGRDE